MIEVQENNKAALKREITVLKEEGARN